MRTSMYYFVAFAIVLLKGVQCVENTESGTVESLNGDTKRSIDQLLDCNGTDATNPLCDPVLQKEIVEAEEKIEAIIEGIEEQVDGASVNSGALIPEAGKTGSATYPGTPETPANPSTTNTTGTSATSGNGGVSNTAPKDTPSGTSTAPVQP